MDISGPVRALLPQLLPQILPAGGAFEASPLMLFAQMAAFPNVAPAQVPPFLQEGAPPLLSLTAVTGQSRPVYGYLAFAAAARILPRVGRGIREQVTAALAAQAEVLLTASQKLLVGRALPVDILWHYWLLALSKKRVRLVVPDMLLKALWQRAWSARRPDAPLHAVSADATLDTALYNDLCALHAAYNVILFTQDFDLFPNVQLLADWHVANTQPDHITTEPWSLAAFASLDSTGTFAPQQLHDLTAHATTHGTTPVTLALLADALAAQEDAAAA